MTDAELLELCLVTIQRYGKKSPDRSAAFIAKSLLEGKIPFPAVDSLPLSHAQKLQASLVGLFGAVRRWHGLGKELPVRSILKNASSGNMDLQWLIDRRYVNKHIDINVDIC